MADPFSPAPDPRINTLGMQPAQQAFGPQQLQAAYLKLLQNQQSKSQAQQQQPIRSWTQVAAGILDSAADQMQLNRLGGMMQQGNSAAATTVPGLPDPGGGGEDVSPGPVPSQAPPQSSGYGGDPTAAGSAPSQGASSQPGTTPQASGGASYDGDLPSFVKTREGFSSTPYADGKQTSIGYGTRARPGDTWISRDEAEQRLHDELGKAAAFVESKAPNAPAPAKHALTDLTYNAGGKWANSGLGNAVTNGDWATAKRLFTQYSHADGKFNQGLYNRRVAMAPAFDDAATLSSGQQGVGQVAGPGVPTAPGAGQPAPQMAGAAPGGTPPQGAPAASPGLLPADPRARQEYQAAQTRAAQLKRFPYGSPEHQEGIQLEEELQKQRLQPPQTITDPRTGQSQFYSPLTGGRPSGLPRQMTPGESEGIASETKSAHTTLTGIRGLGVTGSNLEPYTTAALKIVNDPSFQQTGLISSENQLLFERLKKQFNMPSNATPLAVLNQIRATALNSMQSGAKSFSTEGGEAARLFQSEIETMKGELPAANATAEEQIAGWNAVHRRAVKWGDDALYFNDWVKHQPSGLPTSDIHTELIKRNREFKPYEGTSLGTSGSAPPPPAAASTTPPSGPAARAPGTFPPSPFTPTPGAGLPSSFGGQPMATAAAMPRSPNPPAGGGPNVAKALGTNNPIAQSLAVGDNPFVDPDVAKSLPYTNAAAAAAVTSPWTLPAALRFPNKTVDWAASKLGLSPHETFIPKLVGIEELIRYLTHGGGEK